MRVFRAPGRANLIGEHTDHTDGLVLPAAIDRALTLEDDLRGARIQLISAQATDVVEVPADGSRAPEAGFGRFVAAVAAEVAGVGRTPVGVTGRLSSDLPQGSGLSSSAALEVVLATALCAADGYELESLELAASARACRASSSGRRRTCRGRRDMPRCYLPSQTSRGDIIVIQVRVFGDLDHLVESSLCRFLTLLSEGEHVRELDSPVASRLGVGDLAPLQDLHERGATDA